MGNKPIGPRSSDSPSTGTSLSSAADAARKSRRVEGYSYYACTPDKCNDGWNDDHGGRFIDRGRFAGSCTLTCHGVRHVSFTYRP